MGNGVIAGNKNVITKENRADIRRFIIGNGCIIDPEEEWNFNITYTSDRVKVYSGRLYISGYVALYYSGTSRTFSGISFDFVNANTEQYWFIYAEVDLSVFPNRFDIKRVNNGRSIKRTFRQDNLASEDGVYQKPLWRIKVTKNGIEEVSDLRDIGIYKIEIGEWRSLVGISRAFVYTKYYFDEIGGLFYCKEEDKVDVENMVVGEPYYGFVLDTQYGVEEVVLAEIQSPQNLYNVRFLSSVGILDKMSNCKIYKVNHCDIGRSLTGLNPTIQSSVTVQTRSVNFPFSSVVANTEYVQAAITYYKQL